MAIFRNFFKNFPRCWNDFKLLLKESSNLKNYKPVLAYPDAEIDLTPKPRLYVGLSDKERNDRIKQNLAYVWADGYESKKWSERSIPYLGIRLTPTLVLHETIGCGHGWNLHDAKCLASKCKARLLTRDEYREVLHCWFAISEMRKQAGDSPLEEYFTWIYNKNDANQLNDLGFVLCSATNKVLWLSEFDDTGNVLLALR